MSLDGSFSAAAAVARLLARCPALRADPRVLALASAAAAAGPSREDVAAALAEPLLHPRYTIPVVGCFLPLAPALVDRAVELLRAAAPALRSDDAARQGEEAGEGDVRVVEFYLSRGRGLRLHELACLALARALDLAPYLLRYLLNYFKFAPPPFQRLLPGGVPSPIPVKGLLLFLDPTQVSYRFLELEPRVFCEQWDWSCFLDLVYSTADYSLVDNSLYNVVLDLRWCAIQILMVVLKASDEAVESFGLGADEAFTCFLRSFAQILPWRKPLCIFKRKKSIVKLMQMDSLVWLILCRIGTSLPWEDNIAVESYEVALMAVNQKWPILLYGPVGAGKTALINKLSQIGENRVLFIHMDEQMDGRTLIGSYVCTEKPGEFKWAPGSLTQAIIKGFWIVFEDIDKAPSDVQSILLPLLEGSSSFSIGHAEAVEVAENFRLFATVTTSKNDVSHALEDTFEKANLLVSYQFGGLNLAGGSSESLMQRFSLRDLLKWCKRIHGIDLNFKGLGLSYSCCKLIYFEVLIQKGPFADIRHALEVLERVACSIKFNEPVLLVGETGTGKTTLVQNLASWLKQPLTVVNLSQQSDISDLLGGFKPADARSICFPLYIEFKDLFCRSFSGKDNEAILRHCDVYVMEKNWKKLLRALAKCVEKAQKLINGSRSNTISDWDSFSSRLNAACSQIGSAAGMSFQFVEGAFVSALRNGHWILLDEVNLAPPETLQRIGAVLDGESGTLCLAERGDVDYIERHPCFRMFACMNPATDAGKRDLPYTFRSRFTEFFVDDLIDDADLRLFVNKYLDGLHAAKGVTDSIVRFYKAAKKESEEKLQDGANQKPQFSLRSLSRSLGYIKSAEKKFGFKKALYDGFCMFFLTMLDAPSAKIINNLIVSLLSDGRVPPKISFADYFVEKPKLLNGSESDEFLRSYVLTNSVTEHIVNLARAVYIKKYPVLLQGPTSSGKTSLVRFLAAKTSHEFVRINNHEHTDLQEYLGTYVTDSHGKLQFQEGALVKAVREGHWIVLDELNLAPSDVLEALNRLLDDNRELFVPELQETIPAHPNFMLFATQNPPVLYGGRKMLSRAFRNRFIEVHVDEIPEDELITILEQRCAIARSYATQMVQVMKDLQTHRQNSRVFAGKHGFITPRDLFRWANWYRLFEGKSYEDLAKDGYLLLAERLRDGNEKAVVQEALERHLHVKLSICNLYNMEVSCDNNLSCESIKLRVQETFGNITWTESMWRLYFLIERCYRSREPVLLVGETGGGKTTVCQVLSAVLGVKLHILNCHQYTETSDFIGGFCPIRDRSKIALEFKHLITKMKQMKIFVHVAGDMPLPTDISGAVSVVNHINEILDRYRKEKELFLQVPHNDLGAMEQIKLDLMQLHKRWQAIFLWQDGSLVQAMKNGDLFLIDEISLADDSVLERLNSVLEPERKLSLAEKGGSVLETVVAHPNFFILATMNPGGDYGKKELSPALRNRFTELWVPAVTDVDALKSIAIDRFTKAEVSCFGDCIVNFWMWFNQLHTGRMLTIRDLLSWISFINVTEGNLGPQQALIHGLFLILLDGLTLGMNVSKTEATELRRTCLSFLLEELQKVEGKPLNSDLNDLKNYGWGDHTREIDIGQPDHFGIMPFYIDKGHFACKQQGFEFMAPTTSKNVFRVLRGMQLPKPLLLEGSPGVGKTSLIVALAGFSGHNVVRINLSEQTDMMDLLGSDLPVEGENGMEFAWSDGILLQALKNGSWVLLDELNLAPQSVLEGLNAILDHRAEVFIPELGQTYKCPPSFRVFACQNPLSQGGGRKGLPKSFLNRFTKVYVDELSESDYSFICKSQYPSIKDDILKKLICFNNRLYMDTMIHKKYGQEGSPWEFNLRDIIRSCEMIAGYSDTSKVDCFLNTVYLQRMRTVADREEVVKLFEEVFQIKYNVHQTKMLYVNPQCLVVGSASIRRNRFHTCKVQNNQLNILPGTLHSLEAAMHCINQELLGCFEQYNFFRHYKVVISQVERYVDEYFSLSIDIHWKKLIAERKILFVKWFEFVIARKCSPICTSTLVEMSKNSSLPSLSLVNDIVERIKCDLEMFDLPISFSKDDLSKTLRSIYYLQQSEAVHQPVKFEWVAGDLIRAIECGEWIVLDNANFCNPTVLDRINSLVEQERSIVVNECGLVDGNPVILKAHPKFRMFLTINAKHGEVSRAMRNRGVEIFLMNQNLSMKGYSNAPEDSERKDIIRFLISCGIPRMELVSSMSEAHLYAKAAGLRLGINITLLEITRWVQLFKQLLIKGNQFLWSLHLSWEHTYLPSLGEVNGSNIVEEGKLRFLVRFDGCSTDLHYGFSLSLPGGWPVEQKLKDFIWYSKGTCVQRNCMYLQSLGSQYAAYQISTLKSNSSLLRPITSIHPYVLPATSLFELQFPTVSDQQSVKPCVTGLFNSELADQMLFIAANWVMEQSTENDLKLYAIWFKWYHRLLQPYCNFYENYRNILKQESDHPIWHSILECYREIVAYHKIDVVAHPIPLLSMKLLDMASCVTLKDCHNRLCNSRNGLSLLRLTLQQWQSETKFPDHGIMKVTMLPALKSLRCLEGEVLKMVVKSRKMLRIYSRLLDYHRSIWKMILLSQFEGLPVVWNLLKKEILKLQPKFPVEVGVFLMESVNLNNLQDFNLHYDKPTLWVYGGHPIVPSSGRIFYKIQGILAFSAAVWPRQNLLKGHFDDNQHFIDATLSANQDLRNLAVQGLSMGSLAATITEEDDSTVLAQLDEVHKRLVEKVDWEKKNLDLLSKASTAEVKFCCSVSSDVLCNIDGFNGWVASLPLLNLKSLNLDIVLLQRLSKCAQLDSSESHQVIANTEYLLNQEDLRVMDYQKNRVVLRISSRNLWEGVSFMGNFVLSLHSAADSLFKQIIVVHKKHFKQEEYSKLESILFQQSEHRVKKEDLDTACALLSCSSHGVLASLSGSDELIGSLLLELHSPFSQGYLMHLGAAWMYIGELRFRLLLSSYNPDPAFKSAFMHSHILEKISLLELEGKVRHQCEELAGSSSAEDGYDQKLLQELKTKEKSIRAKVIFRPPQSKHKSLIAACCEFEERLSECKSLLTSLNDNGVEQLVVDKVCNWQITSRNFIKRLTDEYGEYVDLIQPIQVAVYEMKLGLAIALSGYLEREYLKKIKEDDIERALGAIFAIMQFPSGSATGNVSVDMPELTKYGSDDQLEIRYSEVNDLAMLKKLSAVSSQLNVGEVADKLRSHSQMLVSIYHISLVRTTYRVCYSLILDKTSYLSLKGTFDQFTSMWIDMKSSLKARENDDSQYYKFRSRIIDIHDIFKRDVPSLSDMDAEGNAVADTEEKLEQDFLKIMERTDEDNSGVEDTWDLIPESTLKCIVTIHNQLFGSPDLVEKPSKCQISDDQKIQSFIDSYQLGARILKDLPELTSSTFDEKLMPEHLLRVCLEYRLTCAPSLESNNYNTYKDPNPSVLFKMVELLTALQEKVRYFLDEWPGHPGLLKIVDIIASLLAMPLSTPLSKALLGLQLLVGKAQTLQENDSKFFLKDHLPPLFMIMSSWQRLELECWPILLQEVLGKYESNALKLWFPLRALLIQSCDISKNEELSIIKSVEEFVQTSSVGEFKRRLHLILAFHADVGSILKHGKKNQKKTALSNLFKTLEECGLSKHRPMGHEWGNELDAPSPFLEQSYIMAHLLQQEISLKIPEDASAAHATLLSANSWKHANQQYFKCLAMMQQLRQISLKFNKDLGLEEVNRATSFMNHLLSMLSEQRHFAYNIFEQLNEFRHAIFLLGSGGDSDYLSSYQSVLLNSMWQQKQFFDNILAMTMDTNLLLRSFMDCHHDPSDNVQVEVSAMSTLFENFVTRFSESKDLLDKYLLGSNNLIAGSHKNMPLATREMEQLVAANCQLINVFREDIRVLCHQDVSMRSVKKVLLSRLEELLEKGNLSMAILSREVDEDKHVLSSDVLHNLEASYAEAFKEIFSLAIGVVGKLTDLGISTDGTRDSLEGNITLWKDIMQTYVMNLQLVHLCDAGKKLTVSVTSEMTHALGDLLIYLFAEGFGSADDTTEDASDGPQQDAVGTGTGMGEGEGQESASSKIDDISQLEGTTNEKDALCKPNQAPKNDDDAIEMQEDFNAELSDVSEDPEGMDSGDEDDDMNLENQMGDTGDASEMVGKKSWDKDEDDDPNTSAEKYESGSSAKETQKNDRELRAKDEGALEEYPMETDCDEQGKNNNLEDDPSTCEDVDQDTDNVMDKADAYDDRTGPELPEPKDDSEDVDMEGTDHIDEMDADGEELSPDEEKLADGSLDASDDGEDGDVAQHGDNEIDGEQEHAEDGQMETDNVEKEQLQKIESLEHPSQGIQPNNVEMDSNRESESNLANSNDMNSAAAPVNFSSNEAPSLEISMPNSGDGSRLLSNSKPELQTDTPLSQIKQTNPFRSIGDAMADWKERAKVSADTQDHQPETEQHIDDESATEFRYVPDSEQSTSQALGNATADQINDDLQVKQSSMEDENHVRKEEHNTERTPGDDHNLEVPHLQASQSRTNKSENANNFEHREIGTDTSVQDSVQGETDNTFGDFVSMKRPPADEITVLLDDLANDRELSTQMDMDITDEDMKGAIVDWNSVELTTMKLSQELAEQLRLVMEPTLASKLQGDYRTGKRINMKKVVPYIASHFRRDKIWLRRTKPNKRNYQVVIAVDDSRSMSEGKCGKVAIEALVTVCRAMSQLEVGQFAVASFGKKGNVKVLHDFDQVFNGEAGTNVISSLSFEQDNKLEDEPVADLLMYLNTMLDTAVAWSRTPSGQNPLQQLILIISDGKFHEKENLKRCVRNVLNRKRMIAYVLLDSHEESIMDSLEVSYQGAKLTMGKYMDSFPFPYYVMLKNIEALPRTLADLLRQWFELMQSTNE
ncbi:hypothetical protein E2562_037875 [Oryza meyeriana var. granulata]|uniref:Midasin n=1 Tax=Oryza meyeriana var. granulata TaxID=110450 RepID=A0A6G1ETZ6_9ORYZ|nr:hypothetical protein E2562_037875 [Oryza meyeriana var. granulata]